MKVMTIVGTRPEIIKLSRVIPELDRHTEHVLVHTGQNYDYELNAVFFEQLGIRRPDRFLDAAGKTPAETIGNIIARTDEALAEVRPEAVLLYGDTNSCLAVIPAKRRKIPVFHMEAGNRSFDDRVPEEINRRLVDHLSDINMPLTEHARRYLLAEGLRPETVIKTGSPMKEVLNYYHDSIEASAVLGQLGLRPRDYLLVSAHREENVDAERNFSNLLASLNALAARYQKRVIVSTHPRTRKRLDARKDLILDSQIEFITAFGFLDYVKLEMNAACVLSDSGTIAEESSILGFPAVTMREAHERPEGMDEGTLIISDLDPGSVLSAVQVVMDQFEQNPGGLHIVPDYDVDNVSLKVVRIIMSYTSYVNRTVWRRQP